MQFKIRTTKPEAGNKNYIKTTYGGWNTCVIGEPTDKDCNVLSNCVGYASGRFNEIYNEITGHTGSHKWNILNCNAENFIERAIQLGLKISNVPTLGGIMVWQKGTLKWQDGAGHVGVVEKIIDNNTIYTSESAWGGSAFYNSTRSNTNGRWGMGSAYSFRGCIVNPAVEQPEIAKNVKRDESKEQVQVLVDDLNVRTEPNTKALRLGYAKKGYYNVLGKTKTSAYTWVKIADDQYLACDKNEEWAKILPIKKEEEVKPTPTPMPDPVIPPISKLKFKLGDKLVISGRLYRSSNATFSVSSVLGRITKITRVAAGAKHPYNTTGDLGWMDESSITLYEEPKEDTSAIKVGDKVKVTKAVTYDGKRFLVLYNKYDVIEVKGDRVVIGIGRIVTCAINKENIKKV